MCARGEQSGGGREGTPQAAALVSFRQGPGSNESQQRRGEKASRTHHHHRRGRRPCLQRHVATVASGTPYDHHITLLDRLGVPGGGVWFGVGLGLGSGLGFGAQP